MDAFGIGPHPGSMEVRLHDRVDEFRAIAEPLYRRDPVVHTIELTLLRAGMFPEDSLLLTMWDGGAPVGAALQTPPYPLACDAIPVEALPVIADELNRSRPELVGVRGLRDTADAFARAWHVTTGRSGTVTTEERLYWLGHYVLPRRSRVRSGSPPMTSTACLWIGWSGSSWSRSVIRATTAEA